MKILIISRSFFPLNTPRSFRTTELVKEFVRLEHDVTLYIPTSEHDYTSFIQEYPLCIRYFKPSPTKTAFVGIPLVDRVIYHYENWLIDYPSLKNIRVLESALKEEKGYDLLVTIAVPHYIHWAVGKLYEKGHRIAKSWVADCGDPFMLSDCVPQKPPFWFKPLEKRWCRLCDYISVPTETSYKGYYPEFKKKIRVIPQGFNFDDVDLPCYVQNSIPTFAFSGNLIKGIRDPKRLMEWLTTIDTSFKFIVFGSNVRQFFEPYQEKLGNRLVINDPIPRSQLLPILAKMDFLINIGNGTNVHSPSKLIDYTLAKRPIITIETNDIKEHIIQEFLVGNYSHKDKPIDISRYDIHNVAKLFLQLCN